MTDEIETGRHRFLGQTLLLAVTETMGTPLKTLGDRDDEKVVVLTGRTRSIGLTTASNYSSTAVRPRFDVQTSHRCLSGLIRPPTINQFSMGDQPDDLFL